jgi:hypothetical protein
MIVHQNETEQRAGKAIDRALQELKESAPVGVHAEISSRALPRAQT